MMKINCNGNNDTIVLKSEDGDDQFKLGRISARLGVPAYPIENGQRAVTLDVGSVVEFLATGLKK